MYYLIYGTMASWERRYKQDNIISHNVYSAASRSDYNVIIAKLFVGRQYDISGVNEVGTDEGQAGCFPPRQHQVRFTLRPVVIAETLHHQVVRYASRCDQLSLLKHYTTR